MSPSTIVSLSLIILVFSSIITSYIGLNTPVMILNETQVLYLFSTSAQVLASVYGLTLTGFIFFRNELSREEFDDETLAEAVQSLKNRYFKILIFVTFLSIFTLILSNIVISFESDNDSQLTTILINIGQSSFVVNLMVISYFIFDVIAPMRIEKESKVMQQRIDPVPDEVVKGSLENFLINYNKIDNIIQKYGQAYQFEFETSVSTSKRRISNVRLAEFILRAEKIDFRLFEKIKKLITLRNSIIHGAEPIVSENMVKASEEILQELAKALNVGI